MTEPTVRMLMSEKFDNITSHCLDFISKRSVGPAISRKHQQSIWRPTHFAVCYVSYMWSTIYTTYSCTNMQGILYTIFFFFECATTPKSSLSRLAVHLMFCLVCALLCYSVEAFNSKKRHSVNSDESLVDLQPRLSIISVWLPQHKTNWTCSELNRWLMMTGQNVEMKSIFDETNKPKVSCFCRSIGQNQQHNWTSIHSSS